MLLRRPTAIKIPIPVILTNHYLSTYLTYRRVPQLPTPAQAKCKQYIINGECSVTTLLYGRKRGVERDILGGWSGIGDVDKSRVSGQAPLFICIYFQIFGFLFFPPFTDNSGPST